MALTAAGLAPFILVTSQIPVWFIIACQMVMGLGYGPFSSPNTNDIMSSVQNRHLGIASGMNASVRSLGQLLSMAIAMTCFTVFIGPVTITPAVYPSLMTSLTVAFLIFTVSCIMGIGGSYVRGTIHKQ